MQEFDIKNKKIWKPSSHWNFKHTPVTVLEGLWEEPNNICWQLTFQIATWIALRAQFNIWEEKIYYCFGYIHVYRCKL